MRVVIAFMTFHDAIDLGVKFPINIFFVIKRKFSSPSAGCRQLKRDWESQKVDT